MQLKNGIWDQWTADKYHESSPKLAAWLAAALPKDQPVFDFGCGNAFYLRELHARGFVNCIGVEGHQLSNFQHDRILIRDLTKPVNFAFRGSVISLEVGEHLPKEGEQVFLDTITSHCEELLVMSWALPGQPGIGHINCQPAEYIISEVERRGFMSLPKVTEDARANIDENCDWFRRTLLIFQRNG